jgi:uncharacterized damage-inducible protein DinB
MVWTAPVPTPVDGPMTGDDRPILEAYLAWQRATLLNICAGLTGEQLASRPIPASNLSLLGLVRHLSKVERIWLRQRAGAEPIDSLFHHGNGKDEDFNDLDPSRAEADFERYLDECSRGDAAVAEMSFDVTVEARGETYSLRMIYVHLIGEYSRHNGHADLLRESIDGVTGR